MNPALQKILAASLKTLLAVVDLQKADKSPAVYVAELPSRFPSFRTEQQQAIEQAAVDDLEEALAQLDLIAGNSAFVAAGIVKVEERVAAIRTAIEKAPKPNIKVPAQFVQGDGNIVVSGETVRIENIDIRQTSRRLPNQVILGSVATDPYKIAICSIWLSVTTSSGRGKRARTQ